MGSSLPSYLCARMWGVPSSALSLERQKEIVANSDLHLGPSYFIPVLNLEEKPHLAAW